MLLVPFLTYHYLKDIGLKEIGKRLESNHSMKLDVSRLSRDCLSDRGYDVRYGARPLQRLLTRNILNPLSHLVLDGGVKDGDTVHVRTQGEAEILSRQDGERHGWISNDNNDDKNNIVIIRNHPQETTNKREG